MYRRTALLADTIQAPYLRITPGTQRQQGAKMICKPKKNDREPTQLYSPYVGVPPSPGEDVKTPSRCFSSKH